jgi:hypothetical protein
MGRTDRTRDSIDLVPASVGARPRVIEHAVLGEELVDGRSSANGVALTEYVVEVARQQGGYAGHGLSPLGIERGSRWLDRGPLSCGDEIHDNSLLPGHD